MLDRFDDRCALGVMPEASLRTRQRLVGQPRVHLALRPDLALEVRIGLEVIDDMVDVQFLQCRLGIRRVRDGLQRVLRRHRFGDHRQQVINLLGGGVRKAGIAK